MEKSKIKKSGKNINPTSRVSNNWFHNLYEKYDSAKQFTKRNLKKGIFVISSAAVLTAMVGTAWYFGKQHEREINQNTTQSKLDYIVDLEENNYAKMHNADTLWGYVEIDNTSSELIDYLLKEASK